jgi:hypothetical protein
MVAILSVPPEVSMGAGETLPWGFDFGPNLNAGETITIATATLTLAGVAFPAGLQGSPQVVGGIVTQIVTGLTAGKSYLLRVTATVSASKKWEQAVFINVS